MSYTVEEDRLMMLDPERWPKWPVLPVVERVGGRRCGVMFADAKPVVYVMNLYAPAPTPCKNWGERFACPDVETLEYSQWDDLALIWRVD